MALSKGIFIVGAKRTPFGVLGGKLKNFTATDLGVIAAQAAIKAAGIDPRHVDTVIFGNVIQSSKDAAYLARHVALRSGLPQHVPCLTVNRLCGSGFQSVVNAAHELLLGEAHIALAGGTECMSQAPFVVRDVRFGTKFGQVYEFEDTLFQGLTDSYPQLSMALTAENLGAKYNISRSDCDNFALRSQTRFHLAQNQGAFHQEIVPVKVRGKKGEEMFAIDEHPRETSLEQLAKLKPLFKKDGLVTAGTASGINDGAGSIVLATEPAIKEHRLTPLTRLVDWFVCGCDPSIMGIGPVHAIRGLLKKTKMELDKIDLIEVNEAFSAQYLAVEKELNLDPNKTNINGGAIAVGHPLAASGSRIIAHLVFEMKRKNAKYAIGSACIGGGQGIALLVENIE
ncbi:unnamed protein product [Soboliphyme baturini]|uniref:3-ketoacyl-CoA thiolase, mitochondrial n=1 Tax=Soboliphyme baturini TaxID=241478 RepID=A0A183IEW1_9BILA|nr:unnamed protein product [Soboliphyme baturini]